MDAREATEICYYLKSWDVLYVDQDMVELEPGLSLSTAHPTLA